MNAATAGRIVGVALVAALLTYLVPLLLFGSTASPVGSATAAVIIGGYEYRRLNRKPAIPDRYWIILALAALLLYAGALLGGAVPTDSGAWLAMLVVLTFPIVLLIQLYSRRVRRGRGSEET